MVVFVIGATGATAYATVHEAVLQPGQTMQVRNYTLAFDGVTRRTGANFEERSAVVQVVEERQVRSGTLEPGQRAYPAEGQTSNEVSIRTDWRNGEDLFLILDAARADGTVKLKVLINPLVNLLWIAALVFVIGAGVAAWPDGREARRLARRYADATDHRARSDAPSRGDGPARSARRRGDHRDRLAAAAQRRRRGRRGAADGRRRRAVRLREERDQALEALRDLELDRRTGKIADEDFAVLDAELRARAAAAIEALERPE